MAADLSAMALEGLAAQLADALRRRSWKLAVAESCTGGGLGYLLTSLPGSSGWFERGFVTYSNTAKREMLGVTAATLSHHGAVSEPTARAMAKGALAHSHADIAVSITGIAGPGGGSLHKPVGTVCLACAVRNDTMLAMTRRFAGERQQVRSAAIEAAIQLLLHYLNSKT